jgi:hypothetical protein
VDPNPNERREGQGSAISDSWNDLAPRRKDSLAKLQVIVAVVRRNREEEQQP